MPAQVHTESRTIAKGLTSRIISMLIDEVNKHETQTLIRSRVIIPVINMIYAELYPYIIALIATIVVILVISLLTFACFILYYLKNV